jgi:endonuclease YncB( thermonuclease family)
MSVNPQGDVCSPFSENMAKRTSQKHYKPNVKKKTCRVHSVYDGDTVTVDWEKYSWLGFKKDVRHVKVRLAYIDTPELRYKQSGALQAKELLEKLIQGKRVIVEYEQLPAGGARRGDYNRMLAVIHLQRTFLPNVNINQLLLKKGLARMYSNPDDITPHHRKRLIRAERYAQRRHLGIWRFRHEKDSSDMLLYIVIGAVIGILIGIALV